MTEQRIAIIARRLLLALSATYLLLPMVAVFLYSIATVWQARILPDGYTLDAYFRVADDPRAIGSVIRSIGLAAVVTVVDIAIVIPAAYWARVRNPRIRTIVEIGAAIPFALPWLVIAFGFDRLVGAYLPSMQTTVPVLVLGQTAIAFPFFYWAVDGAMAAAGIVRLAEAAETCGARPRQVVRRVLLPVIRPGIITGAVLVFATSLGEFAMARILVGSSFETLPLWQAEALARTSARTNDLAVTTVVSFVLLFILAAWVVARGGGTALRVAPGAERPTGGT